MDAQLAAAFTAGMIATVNPCGFAMLPAYLGFFLGRDDGDAERSTAAHLMRALVVGGAVSAGFLVVFGIAGVLILETTLAIGEWAPWITIVIGTVLAAVGIAFIVGWEPTVNLPHLDKGGKTRGLGSMFVFGVSYAIASLSCTIGVFTSLVAASFRRESFTSGVATFVAYALGMAMILMVVTIALSMAKQGVVHKLRRALPYVTRISGGIMLITGVYLAWYGIYEIRLVQRGDADATAGPVGLVTEWSSDVSNWLSGLDATQVALALGIVVCAAVLVALLRSPKGPASPTRPTDPTD